MSNDRVKDHYDAIGRTYRSTRRADPRVAAALATALGEVSSVANIGAGTGSYEPAQTVVAVEPSLVMIEQRPPGAAPAVRGAAERVPLRDHCVDAAMALMTVHHWSDLRAGLAELGRIARERIVIFTWDPDVTKDFWLLAEYFPAAADIDSKYAVPLEVLTELLGGARVDPLLVPHDCVDGFTAAYWRRPAAYLDPAVRAGMSMFARLDDEVLAPGLARLEHDLRSGQWRERHADLLDREVLDLGYCIVTAEV
jgi:SAM-dependent methyltransferase